MKNVKLTYVLAVLLTMLCALASCTQSGGYSESGGEAIAMRYSELLRLKDCQGYVSAEIINPWDTTKLLHRYILVEADGSMPESLPEGDVVRIPLQKSVVSTSVHCSLINELGAYRAIRGVCDADYLYLKALKDDIKAGNVADVGSSMEPDIEKLIDLSPDAVLMSPYESSGSYGKLGKLGIPLIECADYMEQTALGRAEWIRLFGLLYGQQAKADSIFSCVEKAYLSLRDSASAMKEHPTVLTEMKSGSTWYVAGGNSYVARLLKDAGADYIFKDEPSAGSVPYDPEMVFYRGQKADYWLVKYNQPTVMTKDQLAQQWTLNMQMDAYRNGRVFGVNLSRGTFYEETPFHPELLLRDLVSIFHPGANGARTMRYYQQIR